MDSIKGCLEIPRSGQALQHDAGHGDVNPAFVRTGEALVALAEAARVVEPAKGALDDPAAGQQDEPFALFGAQHHRQAEREPLGDPVHELARIAAVHPDFPELLAAARQMAQQSPRTVAVLHAGGGHHHRQQQPQRVYQEVPLAPIDLLARVVAAHARHRGAFDALAVQAGPRRVLVPPALLPQPAAQRVVQPLPRPVPRPLVKVVIDGRPGRKLAGQLPPLAAGLQHVQNRVDHLPQAHLPGPAHRRHRQQRLQAAPSAVAQMARIALLPFF